MAIVSDKKYYVIEESALPEVILKVIEVKNMLNRGEVKYVSEAVELVGISRSAYYKYQGVVHPFFDYEKHTTYSIGLDLVDESGVLGKILKIFASYNLNILTINQTIPINMIANVTITFETISQDANIQDLLRHLEMSEKVKQVYLLARE